MQDIKRRVQLFSPGYVTEEYLDGVVKDIEEGIEQIGIKKCNCKNKSTNFVIEFTRDEFNTSEDSVSYVYKHICRECGNYSDFDVWGTILIF